MYHIHFGPRYCEHSERKVESNLLFCKYYLNCIFFTIAPVEYWNVVETGIGKQLLLSNKKRFVDVVSMFGGCINFHCWPAFPLNFLNLATLMGASFALHS